MSMNDSWENENVIMSSRMHYLFVDLNGFIVILKLGSILCNFQQTLVSRTG